MASSLVPEGVLLSVGDFAFINQLMKLDGVIDEAIELLKAGNYSNYREVCTTVHSRISALEKEQEAEAEAEAGAKAAAAPGDERPAGGDEVPSLPLPQNRLYYVFTEIYREGVSKAPVDVVPAQNRSDIGKYVLGEATASIRAWIIGHAEESFLSKRRAKGLVKEIIDIYRYYQMTGTHHSVADWSNRDACLAMLGLEPTDEFLMLSAFSTEQEVILGKFISIGRNYAGEKPPQSPPPILVQRPQLEDDEDDDYDGEYGEGADDDDDDDTEVMDLFYQAEDQSFEEIEEPRYVRPPRRTSRRLRGSSPSPD